MRLSFLFIFFLLFTFDKAFANIFETLHRRTKNQKELDKVNLEDPTLKFSLLKILDGSSILVKVKSAKGKTLGVLKFTGNNTYHRGEYAYYQLSRLFDGPYAPTTVIKKLGPRSKNKISDLLRPLDFKASQYYYRYPATVVPKYENRDFLLKKLESSGPVDVAFKAWVRHFQYYEKLGRIENLPSHPVTEFLSKRNRVLPKTQFIVRQCSQIYQPIGCVEGKITMRKLFLDFSKILVLDSIMANRDRFPGANLHFVSSTGKPFSQNKLVPVRLMALDNGAVLLSQRNHAFELLKGKKEKSLRVIRLPKEIRPTFSELVSAVNGPRSNELKNLLGLDLGYNYSFHRVNSWQLFKNNVNSVWSYIQNFSVKNRVRKTTSKTPSKSPKIVQKTWTPKNIRSLNK